MARPIKQGIDYFSFDVDFFQDLKIRKLIKYQGGKAVTVYTLLLCIIYKNGYYMLWDEELPFIISEQLGFEEAYIQEVINSCLNIGLLDKNLYKTKGVLSSKGIQERYQKVTDLSKRKSNIYEFNLIYSEEKRVYSEETQVNSVKSTQSKVKESKVKEKEKKENKFSSSSFPKNAKNREEEVGNFESEKGKNNPLTAEDVENLRLWWNENLKFLPKIIDFTPRQIENLNLLHQSRTQTQAREVFRAANNNFYLSGRVTGRNVKNNAPVGLDWLINPENFRKVESGKYNNNQIDNSEEQAKYQRDIDQEKLTEERLGEIKRDLFKKWELEGREYDFEIFEMEAQEIYCQTYGIQQK